MPWGRCRRTGVQGDRIGAVAGVAAMFGSVELRRVTMLTPPSPAEIVGRGKYFVDYKIYAHAEGDPFRPPFFVVEIF
jgi:hypothetical protein